MIANCLNSTDWTVEYPVSKSQISRSPERTRFTPALLSPRFRLSVGTLVLHGKGGILSLCQDRNRSITSCRRQANIQESAAATVNSPRGQVVRESEILVITEISDFRTTPGSRLDRPYKGMCRWRHTDGTGLSVGKSKVDSVYSPTEETKG
jgi:hypothetical protein